MIPIKLTFLALMQCDQGEKLTEIPHTCEKVH